MSVCHSDGPLLTCPIFRKVLVALMHFCTLSMSTMLAITKHGVYVGIIAPCLVNFIMADMKEVQNCISTVSCLLYKILPSPPPPQYEDEDKFPLYVNTSKYMIACCYPSILISF